MQSRADTIPHAVREESKPFPIDAKLKEGLQWESFASHPTLALEPFPFFQRIDIHHNHIPLGGSSYATPGLILKIGDSYWQLFPDHVLRRPLPANLSVIDLTESENTEYLSDSHGDEDNDDSDLFDDDAILGTPVSDAAPDLVDTSLSESLDSENGAVLKQPIGSSSKYSHPRRVLASKMCFHFRRNLPGSSRTDLDYAIANVRLPKKSEILSITYQKGHIYREITPRDPVEIGLYPTRIVVATASSGPRTGVLRPSPVAVQLPRHPSIFITYSITLNDGQVDLGDCGSPVLDLESGAWLGHLVLAYPGTKEACVIPATEIVKDIENHTKEKVMVVTVQMASPDLGVEGVSQRSETENTPAKPEVVQTSMSLSSPPTPILPVLEEWFDGRVLDSSRSSLSILSYPIPFQSELNRPPQIPKSNEGESTVETLGETGNSRLAQIDLEMERHLPVVTISKAPSSDLDGLVAAIDGERDSVNAFIPLDAQVRFLTRSAIQNKLKATAEKHRHLEIELHLDVWTSKIWDPAQYSLADGTSRRTSRRLLFAALVLADLPERIFGFIQEDLFDKDLPFDCNSRKQFAATEESEIAASPSTPVRDFRNWSRSELWRFGQSQWYFLAPYFNMADGKVGFYDLQDQTPLPFLTSTSMKKEMVAGGFSEVHKVQIHPSHHNYESKIFNVSLSALIFWDATKL